MGRSFLTYLEGPTSWIVESFRIIDRGFKGHRQHGTNPLSSKRLAGFCRRRSWECYPRDTRYSIANGTIAMDLARRPRRHYRIYMAEDAITLTVMMAGSTRRAPRVSRVELVRGTAPYSLVSFAGQTG